MNIEQKKLEIQRRRYAERLRSRDHIPADLDALFQPCPQCHGRRTVCHVTVQDGSQIASLDDCPTCAGDGFILRGTI